MAKQVSSLSVALKADVGGFSGPIKSAAGPVKNLASEGAGLGSVLGKLGPYAAAAGVALGGMAAIGKGFELAAQYETAGVQLRALTGNATIAQTTLKGLRDFAASSPFEFPELLDTSKRLIAAGVNAEALPKILNEAGNVAAGVGAPIGEIGDIFARVASEGKLGSRELREFGRQGIPVVQTLAKQFNTSAAGVERMAESGQIGFTQLEGAFNAMTSKGGRFSGILDAQAQTIGGRWHTLTATMEENSANLAESFIKTFHVADAIGGVTTAVNWLNSALKATANSAFITEYIALYQKWGTVIVYGLGGAIKFVANKLATFYEWEYKAFNIGPIIDGAIKGLREFDDLLNEALDYVLKLEGVDPSTFIKKPEVPQPDPVKITTLLDPSTQQMTIQPEIKLSPAFRAGSAEALAARYGVSSKMSIGSSVGGASVPLLPKPSAAATALPAGAASAMKHAANSDFRKKFGYNGTVTELSDAGLGADGKYHIKSTHGGISGALTPEQFDNLKSFGQGHGPQSASDILKDQIEHARLQTAVSRGTATKDDAAWLAKLDEKHRGVRLNAMSLHDRWQENHGGKQLDSIAQRKQDLSLGIPWDPGELAKARAWNASHPYNKQDLVGAPPLINPGASGPLSGKLGGGKADEKTGQQLDTSNRWLHRIELNTRNTQTVVSL